MRAAPDTMVRLSALLPVVAGVAAYQALNSYADSGRACGDGRSRGQLMADELVARLTNPPAGDVSGRTSSTNPPAGVANRRTDATNPPAGDASGRTAFTNSPGGGTDVSAPSAAGGAAAGEQSAPAERTGCDAYGAPLGRGTSIEIQLIMTDRALLDGDDVPAVIGGYGPIPAALARHLIAATGDDAAGNSGRHAAGPGKSGARAAKVFLRRLFADPDTARLVAMDSRARLFPEAARRFLIARDQICRTPWCDAPIRHLDHITPAARGGPTTLTNGQGLCENCNYTKQSPGWTAHIEGGGNVVVTTPSGCAVSSPEPNLPRSAPWTFPPNENPQPLKAGGPRRTAGLGWR